MLINQVFSLINFHLGILKVDFLNEMDTLRYSRISDVYFQFHVNFMSTLNLCVNLFIFRQLQVVKLLS